MSSSAVWYNTTPHQFVNMNLPSLYQILPNEILCQIFWLSLSDSPFEEPEPQENSDIEMSLPVSMMTTPFTLSTVCHLWREIVRGHPRLWTSVYLVAAPDRAEQQAHLLHEWLSLARGLPLTIEIDCYDDQWFPDDSESALNLLQVILLHSARITAFRTRLPPSCLSPHPEHNIHNPHFTNLTTLSIVPLDGENEEGGDIDVIKIFQGALKLQQVEIREVVFEQLTIPWRNVTKVTAMNVYLEDCVKILRATSESVEECIFEGIQYPTQNLEHNPITLPRLNLLHLDFKELDVSQDLITQIITAPQLKTLEYTTQGNDAFPVEEFVLCTERSGCALTSLAIIQSCMTVEDLQTCLTPVAPSLECLELELTSELEDHTIVAIPSPQVLVHSFPRLRKFNFKGPPTIAQSFLEFLETVYLSHLQ